MSTIHLQGSGRERGRLVGKCCFGLRSAGARVARCAACWRSIHSESTGDLDLRRGFFDRRNRGGVSGILISGKEGITQVSSYSKNRRLERQIKRNVIDYFPSKATCFPMKLVCNSSKHPHTPSNPRHVKKHAAGVLLRGRCVQIWICNESASTGRKAVTRAARLRMARGQWQCPPPFTSSFSSIRNESSLLKKAAWS